jgi:hypothetical protein
MAAIDFPNSPTVGDTFTVGDLTWRWDGSVWQSEPTILSMVGNLDGGDASSNYGGISPIFGGNAVLA